MWTKANRLLLNPIKTLQMREVEKKKERNHTSHCLECLIWTSLYLSQAYAASVYLKSSISSAQSGGVQRSHAFVLDFVKLSSVIPQAIIGSYWSYWSDAHLTYVVRPLRSFIRSLLSGCISASPARQLRPLPAAVNTAVALGSPRCEQVGLRPFMSPLCCLQGETLTSRRKGSHREKTTDYKSDNKQKTRRDEGIKDQRRNWEKGTECENESIQISAFSI